jgi:hypothetical protein
VNICLNDAASNWLEDFNFSTSNKCVISSILVDFLDDINEYIPLVTQILPRAKQEEFLFQLITEQPPGGFQCNYFESALSQLPSLHLHFVIVSLPSGIKILSTLSNWVVQDVINHDYYYYYQINQVDRK